MSISRHPRCARTSSIRRSPRLLGQALALATTLFGFASLASAQLSGGIEGRWLEPKPAPSDGADRCQRTLLDRLQQGDDTQPLDSLIELLRPASEGEPTCTDRVVEPVLPA